MAQTENRQVGGNESIESPASEQELADSDSTQNGAPDSLQGHPPLTNLDSGSPLEVLLTPLHWGPLSLLSFSAYEGYNSNTEFQRIPLGASVTSLSALALFSKQFAGWQANLQYRPFLWISSQRTFKGFAAASFDIRTLRHINGTWHWTLGDRVRYAPTHGTEQASGLIASPGGGFSIGNAFLSSGRNVLENGITTTLVDRYNEHSSLMFHVNQGFTHLSSYLGTQSSDNLPNQDAMTVSSGVTWLNHYNPHDTLTLEYGYRFLTSTNTSLADVQSHKPSIGWSHKFTPSLGLALSAGPAWSIQNREHRYNESGRTRTTVHGSIALSEEFRRGEVTLAFARSDGFSGIISNSFHNRYDLAIRRELTRRFHFSGTASYIQQEVSGSQNTRGELFSGETRYFLSRNWALFTQVRYLHIFGNERFLAPEKSVIVGFRWSWVPDKD